MKMMFFFLSFLICHSLVFSQEIILVDDLGINFVENGSVERIMRNEKDFCFFLVQSNHSSAIKRVYSKLVWKDTASRFGNYFWDLRKEDGSKFIAIDPPHISEGGGSIQSDLHMIYGDKGDSIFSAYDIEKKNLTPLASDTLCFNLLHDSYSLDSGSYKFRIHFRIGSAYSPKNNEIVELYYVTSRWYYFMVPKKMTSSNHIGKSQDCNCKN